MYSVSRFNEGIILKGEKNRTNTDQDVEKNNRRLGAITPVTRLFDNCNIN